MCTCCRVKGFASRGCRGRKRVDVLCLCVAVANPPFRRCPRNLRSNAQICFSFYDLLHEGRFFAFSPQFRAMPDAVVKRTTVRTRASLKRPGNTDELGLESVRRYFYCRIAVPAHINERKMRGQFGIGERMRFLQIAAFRILQAGTNSVM